MSKVLKNIAVFSLWLAGLVIIAHLLIPHDHHSDSGFNNGNDCHASNTGHPANSPGFPMHCHALNDLTFEKTSPIFVVHNNIPTCELFILNFVESAIPVSSFSYIKIKDFHKPLIETDFLRFSPFRAPPALV